MPAATGASQNREEKRSAAVSLLPQKLAPRFQAVCDDIARLICYRLEMRLRCRCGLLRGFLFVHCCECVQGT
jgi:hypothetical protein